MDLRSRLRAGVTTALRQRDRVTADALRSVLAALENAEAVPAPSTSEHIVGVGAADVPRLHLDEAAEQAVVEREIAELRSAAAEYDTHGDADRATELRRAADLIHTATEVREA